MKEVASFDFHLAQAPRQSDSRRQWGGGGGGGGAGIRFY